MRQVDRRGLFLLDFRRIFMGLTNSESEYRPVPRMG
jgi:hypothetical protein